MGGRPVAEHQDLSAVDRDPDVPCRRIVGDPDRMDSGRESLEKMKVGRAKLGDRVGGIVDHVQRAPIG